MLTEPQSPPADYTSTRSIGYFAIAGLAASIAIDLGFGIFSLLEVIAPVASPLDEEDGTRMSLWIILIGLLALARIPIYILTVIVFLIWLNKSFKNLPALRADGGEFSSGWAVGWWFVPFANLVKPFQVVRELWNHSGSGFDQDYTFLSGSGGAPTYMGLWWGCWIGGNILSQIGDNAFETPYKQDIPIYLTIFAVSGFLSFIAGLLLIKIIREIVTKQETRNEELIRSGQINSGPPPPPVFDNQNYGTI